MYLLIFFVLSAVLAIPSFGFSLLAFFIIKVWFDNKAINTILSMATASMREELTQELHHINRGAVHKLFDRFSVDSSEQVRNLTGGVTVYWGVFRHPMIDGGRSFSLRVIYTPRNGTSNKIYIKAAPGFDQEILSENIFEPAFGR
ncbi:hypothetical protein [Pseudomonas sp. BBP2017]|uniref:hypothetical protein n=1 Tax=Pseudomonas sp. BBP2017 TaxID=2109731 RepID=UPI000D13724F|nr:hypothetical protein [Pseudomonas sp. BBP2017]PSS57056.1 hypothetical protein C6382_11245 [Pseudomonas sp. BBP2017]